MHTAKRKETLPRNPRISPPGLTRTFEGSYSSPHLVTFHTASAGRVFMNRKLRFVLIIVALLGLTSVLSAQTATGNIVGRVTDASGALVAGVEVTAVNPATSVTSRATTDEEGIYRLL